MYARGLFKFYPKRVRAINIYRPSNSVVSNVINLSVTLQTSTVILQISFPKHWYPKQRVPQLIHRETRPRRELYPEEKWLLILMEEEGRWHRAGIGRRPFNNLDTKFFSPLAWMPIGNMWKAVWFRRSSVGSGLSVPVRNGRRLQGVYKPRAAVMKHKLFNRNQPRAPSRPVFFAENGL